MMTRRSFLVTFVLAFGCGLNGARAQDGGRPDMAGEAESSPDAGRGYEHIGAVSSWPAPSTPSGPADTAGPTILHTPPVKAIAGGPFLLEAEIADEAGVAAVWLRYRSSPEEGWVSRSMALAGDGRYRIGVDALPVEIQSLEYVLGARDGLGNQALLGSLGEPLRLAFTVPPTPRPVTAEGMSSHTRGLLGVAAVLLAMWLVHRRSVARAAPSAPISTFRDRIVSEQEFWKRLLSPLVGRPMDEQIDAVRLIAARRLRHPIHGLKTFSAPYIMDRLVELHQRDIAAHAHRTQERKPARRQEHRPLAPPERPLSQRNRAVVPPVIVDLASTVEGSLDATFADRAAREITGSFSRLHLDGTLAKPTDWLRHLREELGIDVRLLEHDEEPAATADSTLSGTSS